VQLVVHDPLGVIDAPVQSHVETEGEEAHGVSLKAESINDHLVVAFAGPGIAGRQFPGGFKGEFKPKPRQVENAKRSSGARTDERYNSVHNFCEVLTGLQLDLK
jgi:hypothetical protein